jgi:F-type H+-transporting ATPase subunit gamma
LKHPFFHDNAKAEKELLIIAGSEKGLCGSFNTNLLRKCVQQIKSRDTGIYDIITVGKKVRDFLVRRKFNVIDSYVNVFNKLSYSTGEDIGGKISAMFLSGKYKKVIFAYNEFKNVTQSNIKLEEILPVKERAGRIECRMKAGYLYEPGADEIFKMLMPKYLNVKVYRVLLESNAAEQGMRMAAMEQATKNADEMIKYLQLLYNKSRQASITKELADVVAGADAVA